MRQNNEFGENREKHGHEHDEQHHHNDEGGNHEESHHALNRGFPGRHDHEGSEHGPEHHGHGLDRHGLERHGGRARRGEVRYIVMDALHNGPVHGYEIVKALEERSAGQYVPSPGTIYPMLQNLLDEGMVSASQDGDRRVFQLTEAGQSELDAHAAEVEGFWERFETIGAGQASRHEVAFLEEELNSLGRTIWSGLSAAIKRGDLEMIRRVRQVVARCRDDIRTVISSEGGK